MSGYGDSDSGLLALRRSFEEGFASLPRPQAEGVESLILIRIAGEAFTVRRLQTAGLARNAQILRVPSRIPELLGVTAIRGTLAPVFDLAALLGLPSGGVQPAAQTRCLALNRGEPLVAFAFDEIEGQAEISCADFFDYQESPARACIRQLVRIEDTVRVVADIPALVEAIRQRAGLINADPADKRTAGG